MPCYVDTIVKINQVRQTYKEDLKLIVVWVIGFYPVGYEDYELEMVLFISTVGEERDPNTQAIFEKNKYYCVGEKVVIGNFNGNSRLKITVASSTHLTIKRDFGSNRCPLKVSLVGITQEVPIEINDENAIVNVLVNDYARQKQIEVIEKELYVYAVDISYVDFGFVIKKRASDSGNLSKISKVKNLYSAEKKGRSVVNSVTEDSHSLKRTRVEDENNCIECTDSYIEHANVYDEEGIIDNDEYEEVAVRNNEKLTCSHERSTKGKEKMIVPVVHNTRRRAELSKNINSNVEV
ncbi:24355_t:CDS:2 [Cetraspora pellucida]|uniref:24355_t:CDS:1 n=1 Tax=Cetraspora pellucida TaxID=1433469 RepID=A0A9N9FEW4_9GLOM|nr:24355_t:CDS:2 [Cetraspora pellucida]